MRDWCSFEALSFAASTSDARVGKFLLSQGYINYQMVPFLLISYWWFPMSILAWRCNWVVTSVLLAIFELVHWSSYNLPIHTWKYVMKHHNRKLRDVYLFASILSKPSL